MELDMIEDLSDMTEGQALVEMYKIKKKLDDGVDYDIENAHIDADAVICSVLLYHGYEDLVVQFAALPKWYS